MSTQQNAMHDLRVTGAITFPHYIKHEVLDKTTVNMVTGKTWDNKKGEMVNQYQQYTAAGVAIYHLACDPSEKVEVGQQFKSLFVAGVTYTIKEIINERPAKGDWNFTAIKPVVMSVRAEIDSLTV